MFDEQMNSTPAQPVSSPTSSVPPSTPPPTPGQQFQGNRGMSKFRITMIVIAVLIVVVGLSWVGGSYIKSKIFDVPFLEALNDDPTDYYESGDILKKLSLSSEATEMLENQSFVAVDWGRREDFVEAYKELERSDIPIFVTSDSVLHLYHIQFDETLKEIEEKEFYDDIWQISVALNKKMKELYGQVDDEELKKAVNRNQAYFSVVLNLLKPTSSQVETEEAKDDGFGLMGPRTIESEKFTAEDFANYKYETPEYIAEQVNKELILINDHQGYKYSPNFEYSEDYSQYKARGHYTRSEKLQNYFKAFMYLGRMTFLINGGEKLIVPEDVASVQTIQAAMIANELQLNPDLLEKWNRIYEITSFYVGISDDLTPFDYNESINKVFTGEFDYNNLSQDKVLALQDELNTKESPRVTGGAGQCSVVVEEEVGIIKNEEKCLDQAKGLRFMGQRFIPDSYIMEHLTLTNEKVGEYLGQEPSFTTMYPVPEIGVKGLPRGLEVFAIFGSDRAKEIVQQEGDDNYANYEEAFNELKEEIDQFSDKEWHQNAYWSWMYNLKALTGSYDETYPEFMRSTAWQDKQINSLLSSWTELRHDTILYAKQSYTNTFATSANILPAPKPKPPVGYVEPVTEFYKRLVVLTQNTREMLTSYDVLNDVAKERLEQLEAIVLRLQNISEQELRNEELSSEDYEFIKYFGNEISSAVTEVDNAGLKTTLIADVHTYSDGVNNIALEEGVGYIQKLIVSYTLPDGRTLIGAGPIFSYYEFKQPTSNRLTDEEWRKMLSSENKPEQPAWSRSFKVE
jgi:hypothetical protein